MNKKTAKEIVEKLSGIFTDKPALKFNTPFELLIAVILSAQCTDERVNRVTEKLFKDYNPSASPASWAVRFCASLENVVMVLSGMSNEEQVNDNLSYMENFIPLTETETAMVMKAAEMIRADVLIPCTACRYCVPECPMGIEIPEYFKAYNMIKTDGRDKAIEEFKAIAEKGSKPSDCVKCGACEAVCPQKIKIRDFLCDITEELDK